MQAYIIGRLTIFDKGDFTPIKDEFDQDGHARFGMLFLCVHKYC